MTSHVATIHSRQVQKVIAHAIVLRWSPEVYSTDHNRKEEFPLSIEDQLLRAWILLSDGHRLLVLCIDLDLHDSSRTACTVIADYDLGSHLGNFSFVDFIFNHEYAVVLQKEGIQASIILFTRPERHDIANIKFSDNRGLAISPNSKCFSILTKNEGQDLIMLVTITEMGSLKSSSFSPRAHDAQGIKWCPGGDPLLCVWDSASFGLKAFFFTATGHHIRQMDLDFESSGFLSTSQGIEGLGINTLDWLSCRGKRILAVVDSSGQLLLRDHSGDEKVRVQETLFFLLYDPMTDLLLASASNIHHCTPWYNRRRCTSSLAGVARR
jgi:hypothetical protein